MHYCCLLITKELPTKEEILEIMSPYQETEEYWENIENMTIEEIIKVYPFTWDWFEIGGRYGGFIKYKLDEEDYFYWNSNLNHKKFISNFFDELNKNYVDKIRRAFGREGIVESNFISYLGFQEGFIYCDGAYINKCSFSIDLEGYVCIDAINNKVYARKTWDGKSFIENPDYGNQVEETIKNSQEGFITVLDIHS